VAAAVGVKWNGPHQKFRLAWHMGLSQFLMPCIGYLFGQPLASQLNSYGKYVAAALVAGLGIKMLVEAVESNPGKSSEKIEAGGERVMAYVRRDPTRGMSLIILSLATSLDALVVGFSLSLRAASAF